MNNLICIDIGLPDGTPPDATQCIQFCLDELHDSGVNFPTDMQPNERRLLFENDSVRITLLRDNHDNYQFVYNSIAAGRGTPFASALFKADNFPYAIVVMPEKNTEEIPLAEIECIQLCMNELYNTGFRFPNNMRAGELRNLVKNDHLRVTLRRHVDRDVYQFFYHSIVDGCDTPFNSACFKVERIF